MRSAGHDRGVRPLRIAIATESWTRLVMPEALACGVPVAAFPVIGPTDVIGNSGVGVLDENLRKAALAALQIDGARCRRYALDFSWDRVVEEFLGYLAPISDPPAARSRAPEPRAQAVS